MPSEKSGRVSQRKRKLNAPYRSKARTYVTKARNQITDGADTASESVREAVVALDKAAQRGTIHPRNAARRKSRLMKQLNASAK